MSYEITIPRLGWSMEEGTFLGWLKKPGEFVRAGEPLFELEGEKATQEVESVDSGFLQIPPNAPAPGSVVAVGALLGYLVAEGEPVTGETAESSAAVSIPAKQPAATKIVATPRARRIAGKLGVDWKGIVGTGRNGRIRASDVERAVAAAGPAASMPVAPERAPDSLKVAITSRRRTIADRMHASRRETAPVTLTARADATNLVNLRSQFKASGQPVVPTYTDLVAKLVAAALAQHPLLAAHWENDHIVLPRRYDLGIAVDTEEGLLVPVVRDAHSLPLLQLAAATRDLSERARAGKLTAADMQGGVFTITNLGGYGIEAFTPIINLPQTAILGLGAIRREPVVLEDDRIVPRDEVTLSLTFDHRVVDGAPAARFLKTVRDAVENPSAWLLKGA